MFKPRPGETPQQTGRRFEKFWAKIFGVKPVKGSGSLWYAKMDVKGSSVLWSCKHTDDKSFRVSTDLMREVQQAINGKGGIGGDTLPGIAVSVQGEVYVTMRADDFLYLVNSETDPEFVSSTKAENKRARAKVPAIFREE